MTIMCQCVITSVTTIYILMLHIYTFTSIFYTTYIHTRDPPYITRLILIGCNNV